MKIIIEGPDESPFTLAPGHYQQLWDVIKKLESGQIEGWTVKFEH